MIIFSTVRALLRFLLASAVLELLAAACGWVVLEAGWYNAGAVRQHFQFVHSLLERGMHQSVRFHARDIQPPQSPQMRDPVLGAALYQQHCQQCHGGPGVAQGVIGLSMQPVPGPLVDAANRFEQRELYWIVREGIKMSGMPAWGFHLREDEMWSVVAFLERLPHMTPDEYRATVAAAANRSGQQGGGAPLDTTAARAGDAVRGKAALTQWACQACHRIPGVTGPDVHVGPPLNALRERKFIAGSLPNNEENLMRWIMHTHAIDAQTAMPQLGVPERDARDMAAYLRAQ